VSPEPTGAADCTTPTDPTTRRAVVRRLEELTLNAWPGLKRVVRDGWVASLARGFTGRANSVVPLDRGTSDVLAKVEFFEALYASHGLPATFKLTDVSEPAALAPLLSARGYRESRRASVQVVHGLPDGVEDDAAAAIEARPEPWPAWIEAVVSARSLPAGDAATLLAILDAIALPCRYVASLDSAGVAACGLGVLEDGWVGLYDITTRPDARRRGHAARVVQSTLAWARDNGASAAYLQVMIDNAPAQALYAKLGFSEAYRYAYRTKRIEARIGP
jgi:ribosomal protein S18 acetylase RimI-like enzyme